MTLPVLLIIAVAIFFIGNVLRTAGALNSAAAAGALHASLGYEVGDLGQPCDNGDPATLTVLERVCDSLNQQMVSPEDVEISLEWCGKGKDVDDPEAAVCVNEGNPAYGDVFYVRLRRQMAFGNGLWFGSVPVRSQAAAVVQREVTSD